MASAYPGYVYKAYPKMIFDKSFGILGYKIVNSEDEENLELSKINNSLVVNNYVSKKRGRKKKEVLETEPLEV